MSDSNSVCRKVGLCGAPSHVRIQRDVLLGSNKCTWGPGYWCANLGNAEECGSGVSLYLKYILVRLLCLTVNFYRIKPILFLT